jgi:hypothetical protein
MFNRNIIKFECDEDFCGAYAEPNLSTKFIPSYFKNIPIRMSDSPILSATTKKCIPFIAAMSHGFIIPLWADIYVTAKEGNLSFTSNPAGNHYIDEHHRLQIGEHPLANLPYCNLPMKFINPWIITTKSNYSCLFTNPLNHLENRFKILDGIVDTDRYYSTINFPFLWTGGDGDFLLKKGTPLVNVIPFKRENIKHTVGVIDKSKAKRTINKLATKIDDAYKTMFWHRNNK